MSQCVAVCGDERLAFDDLEAKYVSVFQTLAISLSCFIDPVARRFHHKCGGMCSHRNHAFDDLAGSLRIFFSVFCNAIGCHSFSIFVLYSCQLATDTRLTISL